MRSGPATAILAAALAFSAIALNGFPASGAPDLLLDEGFENGLTWVAAGGTLGITADAGIACEGSHAAVFTAGASLGIIQPPLIPIQPSGSYTLSAAILLNDPHLESVELRINWVDANGVWIARNDTPIVTGDDPNWRSLSTANVQAPPDAVLAQVSVRVLSDGGGTLYIDAVTLEGPRPLPTATPSPTETLSPTATATLVPTATAGATATAVPSATPSATPTPTATPIPGVSAYLQNGGFEEANGNLPTGWSKYGGSLEQTAAYHRGGRFAGAFRSNTASTKWAYQTLTVTGGNAYEFDCYVLLNDPAVRAAFLRVSWYASDDGSSSAIGVSDSPQRLTGDDPSFRYLSTGPMLAPAAARSAKFKIMLAPVSAAPAVLYLDDVSLREVTPEVAATPLPPSAAAQDEATDSGDADTGDAAPPEEPLDATAAAPLRQGESAYPLKVNEVMYDPLQTESEASYEWVELYNAGAESVDLGGWTLTDNSASDTLPAESLPPHAFVVVTASERFREVYPSFRGTLIVLKEGRIGNGLADKGDRLLLRDPSGNLADAVSWGDDAGVLSPPVATATAGHSLERSPAGNDTDSAADFVDNASPSPGRGSGEAVVAGASTVRESTSSSAVSLPDAVAESGALGSLPRLFVALASGLIALAVCLSASFFYRRRLHS